ncbi:hypothetical protein [Ruminiclostridium cellulolyticum]|uniref:Uncharacterized protein n=1 Tax=Ruminiclostridium cellulolyticum (strain ATCC 35319 / DSM 5812 / JCM 6584 / H10) TaxID=394503 RepID=B8I4K3_RUMCH|nr:hypothetical protein [Ruminiclostridium cellulolyticum]ACL74557.1 hypothetical protein Ccel_0169 [Ruminiclostridium cellulolyticum H10]
MKRFIIIIVFLFLIALLISFNYLLWDREKQLENFQDLRDAKNFTIDTLGEKNNALDKKNRELTEKIDSLNLAISDLKDEFNRLSVENTDLKNQVSDYADLINQFKKNMNTMPINGLIKNWFEAINTKNYKVASALISKNSHDEILNNPANFSKTYQEEIKSINLKSLHIFTDLSDQEHLGKIQFRIITEVEKPESQQTDKLYKSGDNEKYITVEFNTQSKEWLILEVSDKP